MRFISLDFLNHISQHRGGCHEAHGVADGHGEPDAVQAPPFRQDGKQRDEEEHLPRDAQEDALSSVTYALEEVSNDHLSTHKRECCYNETEGTNCFVGQLRTCSEDMNHGSWDEFASQEGCKADACCSDYAVTKHSEDAVVLPCTPVVAHDWLHALNQAEHDGGKQEDHSVHD